MRFIITTLIILLLAAFLGIQLKEDPGRILISINQWTLETTVWFGIVSLIIAFILLHALLVFIKKLSIVPQKIKNWQQERQVKRAQAMTRKGLIEFSEGYWSLAKKHLTQALPFAETPLINYLTAARAAQELGENQRRDDYLRQAQQSMPETTIAVELTQAQLQLADQQWEQALATLKHLQAIAPRHPHVLKLLMSLYQELKDWPQLIALLPQLKKEDVISEAVYNNLRLDAYSNAIQDLTKNHQGQDLADFMKNCPKDIKTNPEIIALYAGYFIQEKEFNKAETILRAALKKELNEQLITLYGLFFIRKEQIAFAEELLKKNPSSASLYLCLGRLCLANQLWGKAESYLEKSIELKPNAEAYAELAQYYAARNQHKKACNAYQAALDMGFKGKLSPSSPNLLPPAGEGWGE